MRTIRTKVYKFNELNKAAQEKAIHDHIEFEISEIGLRDSDEELNPYYPIAVEMENNHTEWFLHSVIYDRCKQMIVDTIEANEYEFTSDGRMI